MKELPPIKARLALSGTLECRDADGNVIKTMQFTGSLPLTSEEAEQLKGAEDGADNRE